MRFTAFHEHETSLLTLRILLILNYSFHWSFRNLYTMWFHLLILCHAINFVKLFHYFDWVLFFRGPTSPSQHFHLCLLSWPGCRIRHLFNLLRAYLQYLIINPLHHVFRHWIQYKLPLISDYIGAIVIEPVDEECLLNLLIPLLHFLVSFLLDYRLLLIYSLNSSRVALTCCGMLLLK